MRTIYRGYVIVCDGTKYRVFKSGESKPRAVCVTEDDAYHWVDGEKAIEHKAGAGHA